MASPGGDRHNELSLRSLIVKILVAEDEPKTGIYLKQGLTEAGFLVDLVTNGIDAVQQALKERLKKTF